jgi:hypothetical protein
MGKHEKLLLQVLRGTSDSNIPFEGLRAMLYWLGFQERIRGAITSSRRKAWSRS